MQDINLLIRSKPLLSKYNTLLVDIWGVLHNGVEVFEGAIEVLKEFKSKQGNIALVTNSPRFNRDVIKQLQNLGITNDCYDFVVTSGDVAVDILIKYSSHNLYFIGPNEHLSLFEYIAKTTGHATKFTNLKEAEYVVCSGIPKDYSYNTDFYEKQMYEMLTRKITMICLNPDIIVNYGGRIIYCAGAIAKKFSDMGGRVIYSGKPYDPIYKRAISKIKKLLNSDDNLSIMAIGDTILTDVLGALKNNIDVIFVANKDCSNPRITIKDQYLELLNLQSNYPDNRINLIEKLSW